ncbi:EexN family lipoprotein [Salmonella enterica subsp. diarizonae]|nr:EexN family lipoprotein [Salmonella enterica subsp. diarizonae]EEJ1168871.1 EexN family lipoprotein [Salmonella enterica subsp. enterica serovar Typhimurium]EGN0658008.1 EexN family lipoprotein [Salmonella enterica subsp. enterica serovar Typhimurium]
MQYVKILLISLVGFFIAACEEKVNDIDWYRNNYEQAKAVVDKCRDGKMSGQNCFNARQGIREYKAGKFLEQLDGK